MEQASGYFRERCGKTKVLGGLAHSSELGPQFRLFFSICGAILLHFLRMFLSSGASRGADLLRRPADIRLAENVVDVALASHHHRPANTREISWNSTKKRTEHLAIVAADGGWVCAGESKPDEMEDEVAGGPYFFGKTRRRATSLCLVS